MQIATLNIKDHGQQTTSVPQGAKFQSCLYLGGVVQVNYSFDSPTAIQENADLRVVDNLEDYPDTYVYLGHIVMSNSQVRHVLYKPNNGPGGPVATPV